MSRSARNPANTDVRLNQSTLSNNLLPDKMRIRLILNNLNNLSLLNRLRLLISNINNRRRPQFHLEVSAITLDLLNLSLSDSSLDRLIACLVILRLPVLS